MALYGLRQATRVWNVKLDATLKDMGFWQSAHEAASYRWGSGRSVLLVGIYVDEKCAKLLVGSPSVRCTTPSASSCWAAWMVATQPTPQWSSALGLAVTARWKKWILCTTGG